MDSIAERATDLALDGKDVAVSCGGDHRRNHRGNIVRDPGSKCVWRHTNFAKRVVGDQHPLPRMVKHEMAGAGQNRRVHLCNIYPSISCGQHHDLVFAMKYLARG